MVIDKSESWGQRVHCASPVTMLRRDRDLGGTTPEAGVLTLLSGNLWRCLGSPQPAKPNSDGIAVTLDALVLQWPGSGDPPLVAADSVVVRRPWWRGGLLVGPVLWASNSGVHGSRSTHPRAHPNDGHWDLLVVDAAMGVKQRLVAWRRARRGDHVPHPHLHLEKLVRMRLDIGSGDVLLVDGRRARHRGGADLHVAVDRWTVAFASPTV